MKISSDCTKIKKYFESCKLEAYPDPGSKDGKPYTIGWGHTGPEVHLGLVWTQEQADEALEKDADKFSRGVGSSISVPLSQKQFDALVSLAFNIGIGAFRSSTLLKKLDASDYAGAAQEFQRWNKNDGEVMLGLTRRRKAEQILFEGMPVDFAISEAAKIK